MAGFEGERCGICMDMIVDRSLLDCCQNWFCFECIYNWSSIMNLCPLCQREFQLITCVPVNYSGESSKVDEVSLSGYYFHSLFSSLKNFTFLNHLTGVFVDWLIMNK
ncbi:hypothetical protein Bca101_058706 [Brassica carinata]